MSGIGGDDLLTGAGYLEGDYFVGEAIYRT
jgi:hypothetical protein